MAARRARAIPSGRSSVSWRIFGRRAWRDCCWRDESDENKGAAARPIGKLRREERLGLARRLARLGLASWTRADGRTPKATAGGVDLRQVDARTMASRLVPGLYFCGEILDVDGRIGGFNFSMGLVQRTPGRPRRRQWR